MTNMPAKLYFRYGTMNSGKSLILLSMAHNFQERGVPCIMMKSSIDTRDVGSIKSRALAEEVPCKIIAPDDTVIGSKYELSKYKWILVDEAQFLTAAQVDRFSQIVDEYGINVMCFGLRTDFKTNLFPGSKRLFELADSIEEFKSSCECGRKTIVNARIDKNGNVITHGAQIEVGAEDRYISLCRKCYKKKIKPVENE